MLHCFRLDGDIMDNSLYSYLLWRKQSSSTDSDRSTDDNHSSLSEFGFIKPTIVPAGRQTMVRKLFKQAVKEVLVEDGLGGEYYADNYRCWPPPLFIIFITLAEV